MTRAIILEPDEWEDFKRDTLKTFREELSKVRAEVMESPMNAKETAKYLKCSPTTVYTKWTHLRHMVDGTPYWFRSEIEAYIKEQ